MIFDGIIELLQPHGGVSVYFSEIIKRHQKENQSSYLRYASNGIIEANEQSTINLTPRFAERYRDVNLGMAGLFHSSYYRLPSVDIPVVTTVHDFTYEKYVHGLARHIHIWQKRRAIRNSDKIICVSENTAKDLLAYCGVDESRIEVVYNGVSEDYYQISHRSKHSEDVVFVGARRGYKNFSVAVEAVAQTKHLKLNIVGGGKLTSHELAILDAKLQGRYIWRGWLSNQELNELYNNAYCLLYPSSYEGFGIPVIEAMQAGCPVIALNSSSIPEVAGNAALLLDSLDTREFTEALMSLDNSQYRNSLINSGFVNSQRFSWDKCYVGTSKVYSTLL